MHVSERGRILLPVPVEHRLNVLALAAVFGVGNHADNLKFAIAVSESDSFTQHVIAGKEPLPKGLIYDDYRGRIAVVSYRELTAAQDGNLHRRKIVFTH